MRRALVLLAVAGGLAAVFATAAQAPPTALVSTTFSRLILVSDNTRGCSLAQPGLPTPGPIIFTCRTHREAERLAAHLDRGNPFGAASDPVRGTKVVFP